MQVIDYQPSAWFLVQDGERLFLDVNCSQSFVSYDFVMELDHRERNGYATEGRQFISALAEKVEHSAPGVRDSSSPYRDRQVQGELRTRLNAVTIGWIGRRSPGHPA